jgi:phage tail-like protein
LGFTYVNRDGEWFDFERHGIEVDAGTAVLARLPALASPLAADLAAQLVSPVSEPSGIAVAPDGSIFFTVPGADTIARVDGCDGRDAPVPCIGGTGDTPPQLRAPSGLAVPADRDVLLVVDTGNHRVQVFDLATFQLLDVWGDGGYGAAAVPSSAIGRFDTPSAIATDAASRVYVSERGNARVQQFIAGGQVVASFWQTLSAQAAMRDPVAIAVSGDREQTTVYVLDRDPQTLYVVDASGHLLSKHALDVTGDVFGLAVDDDAIYVGSNTETGGNVWRIWLDGSPSEAAPGYTGPVAALALDVSGGLLVHPGWSLAPIRLARDRAHVRHGYAFDGPFGGFTANEKHWRELRATMPALPPDAHIRFFVHTTNDADARPPVGADPDDPFADPVWTAGPSDTGDFLIAAADATFAWVGFEISGEGATSARIEQIRLEFDHPTYLDHLPAIYRRPEDPDAFLPRYLALVESMFRDVEDEIDGLTRLLDAAAAPEAFLMELARWLAFDVSANWDDAERRDGVAHAYAEAESRGTAAGLRTALRRATGIDAWIEEPLRQSAWWALAPGEESADAERETSVLGVTTMLAATEPQGAVLGSTATVNRSQLVTNDDYGVPLFDDVAHRFVVRLYQGAAMSEERLRSVMALLDRERPAHTDYVVCRVDPRLEVGVQSRIGVDAIVGGAPLPAPLDDDALLGDTLVLGGEPPGRIGQRSEIGVTTLLGRAAVGDSVQGA